MKKFELLRTLTFLVLFVFGITNSIFAENNNSTEPQNTDSQWWNSLTAEWKAVFIERYPAIEGTPTQEQLNEILTLPELNCSNTQITTLAPVAKLTELHTFICTNTPVTDLEPLKDLKKLRILNISKTNVNSLQPLSQITTLEKLFCSQTLIVSLAPLANCENLKMLKCDNNIIRDLNPVRNMANLEILDVSGNYYIQSLEPLSNLSRLRRVNLDSTRIKDLKPLATLPNLQFLGFSQCNIESLKFVSTIATLKEIDCSLNRDVKSLEPLYTLPALVKITCYGTSITQAEIDAFKRVNVNCEIIRTKPLAEE